MAFPSQSSMYPKLTIERLSPIVPVPIQKSGGELKAKRAKPECSSMFAEMLRQVRKVPRGKVATYGDVAYAAGHPGAARQVAWALHSESAELPWHRIVGAGGKILLSGEQGFEQRMRLQAEGIGFVGLKVNMLAHRYTFFPVRGEKKKSAPRRSKPAPRNER